MASAELRLKRESTYNLGMYPGARRETLKDVPGYAPDDYAHSQRTMCGTAENGYSANWYEFSQCMYTRYGIDTNPDAFIAAVKAHEGYGTTGHNGHFSATYDAVAAPGNDPLIFLDQRIGSNKLGSTAFVEEVRRLYRLRAGLADEEARHVGEGGKVSDNWAGAVWLWFPLEGRYHKDTHRN